MKAPEASTRDALETALEPVARRMERANLSIDFVRTLLADPQRLELNAVAMQWTGMPNKNERAVLREVFGALTEAGFVKPDGDDAWLAMQRREGG